MFALPWTRQTVPHAVIEITQDCNLACEACYRKKAVGMRPVNEILDDVRIIEKHQRVHTISLAGGEPTLHPDLPTIVKKVKARGHCVSLVTNGLLLSDDVLAALASAGLDIVMIHVDEGQRRPDLPEPANIEQINRLREQMAMRVHSHGISAGLCTTIYPKSLPNIPSLIGLFMRNPHINFLFATHAVAIPDLVKGVQKGTHSLPVDRTTNSMVIQNMRDHFTLEPYAFIPPTTFATDGELPCITYSVPVAHGRKPHYLAMKSGRADRILVRLSRVLAGRYLYFTPNRILANQIQIIVNGLFSGRILRTAKFLLRSKPSQLRIKRLVFENAPRITPQGTVNCCDFCPNSTVRDGVVIPVCLADHANALKLTSPGR
jgi:hypothetical protein